MKVYVVIHHDYEEHEILAIYSTREKAERAKKRNGDFHQYDAQTVDAPEDVEHHDATAWQRRNEAQQWAEAEIHEWSVS